MDRTVKIKTGPLGRTGLTVSRLGLGTVALGLDYGIKIDQGYGRPAVEAAVGTIRSALNQGVTFFDTAPAYGRSEALLGQALAKGAKSGRGHQGNFGAGLDRPGAERPCRRLGPGQLGRP